MRKAWFALLLIVVIFFSSSCGIINVDVPLQGKRFASMEVDAKTFVQPSQTTTYATLDAAWNALETGYIYRVDNWYLTDKYGQAIPGGNDTWLMPSETQYLIDHYPSSHNMDCEDGAIWLTSALKKEGLDAWFCVGTVIIDGQIYGHAWCMVLQTGVWTTYETTVGHFEKGLPDIYTLQWRTNGITTWRNLMTGCSVMNLPPVPPELLTVLKNTFN